MLVGDERGGRRGICERSTSLGNRHSQILTCKRPFTTWAVAGGGQCMTFSLCHLLHRRGDNNATNCVEILRRVCIMTSIREYESRALGYTTLFYSIRHYYILTRFLFINAEDLPQKVNLSKRPLATQHSRSSLILVLWIPNLFTEPLVCTHQPSQSRSMYAARQALDGQLSESRRIVNRIACEPYRELVQSSLQSGRRRRW